MASNDETVEPTQQRVGAKTQALMSKSASDQARAEATEVAARAQAEAAADREVRNSESEDRDKDRLVDIMKTQTAAAEKNATLWFRLAMAELAVIVSICLGLAVLFLGGSMSFDPSTGSLEVAGDGPAAETPTPTPTPTPAEAPAPE